MTCGNVLWFTINILQKNIFEKKKKNLSFQQRGTNERNLIIQ